MVATRTANPMMTAFFMFSSIAKRKPESLHGADELEAEQIIFCVETESPVAALRFW